MDFVEFKENRQVDLVIDDESWQALKKAVGLNDSEEAGIEAGD